MNINKDNIVKDFEFKAKSYYDNNYTNINHNNYVRNLRRELIISKIDFSKKYDYVLDCGCGPALLYNNLLEISSNYIALDLSEDNLKEIKKQNTCKSLICLQADIDNYTLRDNNKFDLIICSGSLEYTLNPVINLVKLIDYLKAGGKLIISFPNNLSLYRIWGKYIYKYLYKIKNKMMKKKSYYYGTTLFNESYIRKILGDSNIKNIDSTYIGSKFILQPFDNILCKLDYKIMRSDLLEKIKLLNLFKYEFILEIYKN